MIDRPAFLALVIPFTEYGIVITEFRVATIPTPTFELEGFACRPVDQFRPLEYFSFCVFGLHKYIMTKDGDFDNGKQKR